MKLIILDRDGVINEDSPHYIKHPDEWIPIPGSLQAIAKLKRAGWTVAIASNQSGLARGLFDMTTLADIHHKLRRELSQVGGSVDAIFVCPHGPDDACHCRKPLPGLFLDIARSRPNDHWVFECQRSAPPASHKQSSNGMQTPCLIAEDLAVISKGIVSI